MSRALVLLVFLPFLLAELVLGSSAATLLLCAGSIIIGFAPYIFAGRDLYSVLCAIFALRYTGVALVAKTLYGQSLDSNLHDPVFAYTLTGSFLVAETLIFMLVRCFDQRTALFTRLVTLAQYRRAGLLAALIGGAAQLVIVGIVSRRSGTANTGGVYIIAFYLTKLYLLGLALECIYTIKNSAGRRCVSLRLGMMLSIAIAMTLLLNMREFFIDCVIVIAVTAFLHHALTWRHVVIGAVFMTAGSLYLSPMVLALRSVKYGKTPLEFVQLAADTAVKTFSDPVYRAELVERQKFTDRREKGTLLYDYYGDGSNIPNRLSYVGLVDAVLNAAHDREPIGMAAASEVWDRIVPRFLASDKRNRPYEYGDWLCWKTGLMENGRIFAANFGLPMEGLAVAGIAGFLLFPIVFMLPVMLLITRISSFREPMATSIFLFAGFQHPLMEAASDGFINIVTRALPIMALACMGIYWMASLRFTWLHGRSRTVNPSAV